MVVYEKAWSFIEVKHRTHEDDPENADRPYLTMLPLVTTLLIALLALAAASLSSTRRDGPHQQDPVLDNLASREFFYVGGEYVNASLVRDLYQLQDGC